MTYSMKIYKIDNEGAQSTHLRQKKKPYYMDGQTKKFRNFVSETYLILVFNLLLCTRVRIELLNLNKEIDTSYKYYKRKLTTKKEMIILIILKGLFSSFRFKITNKWKNTTRLGELGSWLFKWNTNFRTKKNISLLNVVSIELHTVSPTFVQFVGTLPGYNISRFPQNIRLFELWFLRWNQIYSRRTVSWTLETGNGHWVLNLENLVNQGAIRRAIHEISLEWQRAFSPLHYLGGKSISDVFFFKFSKPQWGREVTYEIPLGTFRHYFGAFSPIILNCS